ncbi:MAG: TIGR00299 family protein [Acidimicrobiaceae bacterium]|nr:TIGR00299 family protein [Acidimicrobiaceae bacterium]
MSLSLWIDPSFGASGDMLLGAFAEMLTDPEQALFPIRDLALEDWEIDFEKTLRNGLTATKAEVTYRETSTGRKWSEIDALLKDSSLPHQVIEGSRRTFLLLAEVEAEQHGVSVDDVHFHEVGAVDAILDVVGTWLLRFGLEDDVGVIDEIAVGSVGLGSGSVKASHGTLPLPAPATIGILKDCPVTNVSTNSETCTPTGAALLVSMANRWGNMPKGYIRKSSRGAGTRNPDDYPNIISMVLTENTETQISNTTRYLIETNVDDVTPEILATTIEKLLELGAEDAWITPIIMKKGRPGHEIKVLCSSDDLDSLKNLLLVSTGSLGCRIIQIDKTELDRTFETITLYGETVNFKVGPFGAKPEQRDLLRISEKTNISLRQLTDEANLFFNQKSK